MHDDDLDVIRAVVAEVIAHMQASGGSRAEGEAALILRPAADGGYSRFGGAALDAELFHPVADQGEVLIPCIGGEEVRDPADVQLGVRGQKSGCGPSVPGSRRSARRR